jgi:hypothetical protein
MRVKPIAETTVARRQFVLLCRKLDLFSDAVIGIGGSKFKAVNNRDENYTPYKLQRRIEQIETSIARYLSAMEAADRQESEVAQAKSITSDGGVMLLAQAERRLGIADRYGPADHSFQASNSMLRVDPTTS